MSIKQCTYTLLNMCVNLGRKCFGGKRDSGSLESLSWVQEGSPGKYGVSLRWAEILYAKSDLG